MLKGKQTMKQIAVVLMAGMVAVGGFMSNTAVAKSEPPINKKASKYQWKEKTAPNYVVRTGKAKVTTKIKKGKVKYSKLDKYGRAGSVTARITWKMVKKSLGWRQDIPESEAPSGWGHNGMAAIKLYNGRIYHGYFFNRSHLLADSLGGKAIKRNLITGTRTQNVGANDSTGGMAYTEQKAFKYIKKHKKVNIYYKATPVYKGSELLPRSVIVNMKSSDKKLNMRVIVYNAAKGYTVNYKMGTYSGSGASPDTGKTNQGSDQTQGEVYITATGTKYHRDRNCRGLSRAKNVYKVTLKEAKGKGLTPCSLCY